MNIKSLRLYDESLPLNELFQIQGAIRSVIAISAYIDLESIDQLINFVSNGADSRGKPTLKVFIDKSSSRFFSDRGIQAKFIEATKKILNICDSESGIFLVQLGALFHSKAYLIEGNKKAKILLGSMNLTQKGINGNEELIFSEDINVGKKTNANRLSLWMKEYAEALLKKSVKVGSGAEGQFPSCMRQLLLDGSIYYELKEQNPFRFKLYLPEEIANQQANVDQLLEASITDSVSLEALITTSSPMGLDIKLPGLSGTKAFWKKRFCIETCYGYWNPDCLRENLRDTLKKRIEKRRPHFDEIKRVLHKKEREINALFMGLHSRIQTHLESVGIIDWKYASKSTAEEAWNKWIKNTKSKIENDEYYERLVSGISNVPSPDVWSDPLSSEEFEDSFCETLLYHWSKEYSKETSNLVAQAFSRNLDLWEDEKNTLSNEQLKNLINQWLISNPCLNIVCFNEEGS
ncbi:MAG: phospholipase D family protein [Desulfocapsaceae bacterium]|nr:phospholipase D family protein [Desulfocapsaceae bacterium]